MAVRRSGVVDVISLMAATAVVVLLATAATKQLHKLAGNLAVTSSSSTLTTRPALLPSSRLSAQPSKLHAAFVEASSERPEQVQMMPGSDSQPHGVTAVTAGLLAVVGMVGYLWKRSTSSSSSIALASVTGSRPTMADTKLKFLTACDSSIPNMYNIPLQELLAQHHLLRFNSKYQYDEVFALGIVTVINQLLEGMAEADSERIQNAYFTALEDSMAKFKSDAAALEQWASTKGKDLNLSGDDEVTQKLKAIASRATTGEFQYSKFFSIGLFQLLQQSGQTDPETFSSLVSGMSLDKERVTKDLKVYKDLLKRLEMAKDMKEKFLERERKKQQERMAQKQQPTSV